MDTKALQGLYYRIDIQVRGDEGDEEEAGEQGAGCKGENKKLPFSPLPLFNTPCPMPNPRLINLSFSIQKALNLS
jgi:hypothetical protein